MYSWNNRSNRSVDWITMSCSVIWLENWVWHCLAGSALDLMVVYRIWWWQEEHSWVSLWMTVGTLSLVNVWLEHLVSAFWLCMSWTQQGPLIVYYSNPRSGSDTRSQEEGVWLECSWVSSGFRVYVLGYYGGNTWFHCVQLEYRVSLYKSGWNTRSQCVWLEHWVQHTWYHHGEMAGTWNNRPHCTQQCMAGILGRLMMMYGWNTGTTESHSVQWWLKHQVSALWMTGDWNTRSHSSWCMLTFEYWVSLLLCIMLETSVATGEYI